MSSISPKEYDVFISFRGEDTRKSFTSHLHHELCVAGIKAFIDDPDLPKGDTVWASLCQAIHNSQIAIIVFSANYASSKWCLEEVMEILKCRQSEGQIVIPVFYDVDPSDIRKQTGSYGEAFSKYGDNSNNQSILNKVPAWKAALTEAAGVSGWDSRTYGNESQLIKNIVNDVSQKLFLMYPQEPKDKRLVGMDKICEKVQQLLSKKKQEQLQENVKVIGIWGMGGIGKTTVAKVLFSRLFPLYDNVCFLENIRELSKNDRRSKLKELSNTLLSEVLKDENLKFNPSRSTFIASRLSSKKVLIVLDDVDSFDQLYELCEVYRYAGPESIVILTTRDRQLLVGKVDEIYKAEMMSFYESLELFCLHAFKQRCPQEGYEELSKTAVDYAGGVPLALKVLGSNLYSRSAEVWDCELRKVKNYLHKGIDSVLRVSYDGLDIPQQKIFLDIAFFFKGECKGSVERILNACDFFATSGLEVLENKALITVSDGRIQMHDLLQEMSLDIVRKGIEYPGKRSRLADIGEVCDVLMNKKGSDAVEGIILNLSHLDRLLYLGADSFNMMNKLRILQLYNSSSRTSAAVIYHKVFDKISDNLRYFEWHGYTLKSLPTNFSAKMLVEIHMPYSNVIELWQGVQDVVNLEVIYLRKCKYLNRLPNLSKASKLKEVDLTDCESLFAVHPSILSLDTLKTLILNGCKKLEHLKSDKHLRSLQNLSIKYCPGLKDFSISSDEIETLDFMPAGIEKLHSSLGNLTRLRHLYIDGLRLRNLPNCRLSASLKSLVIKNCRVVMDKQKLHVLLEGLTHLSDLELTHCCKMSELPDNISGLSNLKRLTLFGSSVERLPESIKHLSKLHYLCLENCMKLQWLPELPPNLTQLNVDSCRKLQHLPELTPNLTELNVASCSKLQHLPELPPNLTKLNVAWCGKLQHLPELPPNLTKLNVAWCVELQHLPELPPNLEELNVANCRKLQHLPELSPNLRVLNAANCSKLQHLPELPPNLEELNVVNCRKLEHIPELPPQMRKLRARNCNSLVTLSTSKVLAGMPPSKPRLHHSWICMRIWMRLENCKKLDSHSFMESTLLAMMNFLFHVKYGQFIEYDWDVCLPESKVPRQLKYRTKGSSLTITLPPEPLLGFIFCAVLSPSMIFDNLGARIKCRCYRPDDTYARHVAESYLFYSTDWHFDHAYIWCDATEDFPLYLGQQLSFEFSCNGGDVKACGVHPVPISEDVHHSILGLYSELGIELNHHVAQRAEQRLSSKLRAELLYGCFFPDFESEHSETLTVIETSDDEMECNDQNNQEPDSSTNQDSDSDDDWLFYSDSESQSSETLTVIERSDDEKECSDQNNQDSD